MDNHQQIKSTGLRVTPTRLAVLSILNSSQKPMDIASIYDAVARQHVDADQATIYRIIENFIDKGLIAKVQFQEKKFYYEALRSEHHHAMCTSCGVIEDVSNCSISNLESEIEASHGFKVATHSLEFYGLCATCQ